MYKPPTHTIPSKGRFWDTEAKEIPSSDHLKTINHGLGLPGSIYIYIYTLGVQDHF